MKEGVSLMPSFILSLYCSKFSGNVCSASVVKPCGDEVLHKVVSSVEQFIVVGDKVDESFELVKLCFLYHSPEFLGLRRQRYKKFG